MAYYTKYINPQALCKAFDILEFSNLNPEDIKLYIRARENDRAYQSIMHQHEEAALNR